MEEQILKILNKNIKLIYIKEELCGSDHPRLSEKGHLELNGKSESAKEITSHMMKFVEWCIDECFTSPNKNEDGVEYNFWDIESYKANAPKTFVSLEEVYQYWCDNVNKE